MKITTSQLRRLIREEVSSARRSPARRVRRLREGNRVPDNGQILDFMYDYIEANPIPPQDRSDDPYDQTGSDAYNERMYQAACDHFGQDCDHPDRAFEHNMEVAFWALAGG